MSARLALVVVVAAGGLTLGGVEAASALGLGSPTLVSITVSPATASIDAGGTEQFTATGTYSNLTTANFTDEVTWSSSVTSAATVSNSPGSQGLATGVGTGVSTITATDPSSLVDGTAVLTVLPVSLPVTLVAITVTPAVAEVEAGELQQFTATGTYSNLTTANLTDEVTWSSSVTSAATVSNSPTTQGLATGVGDGASTITATDPSSLLDGTAVLTVLPVTVPVEPSSPPTLGVSPDSGSRKAPIAVEGTGFHPGDTVTVSYLSGAKKKRRATTVLCSVPVSSNGSFTCQATVPKRARSGRLGRHTVDAVGSSGTRDTATFDLVKHRRR
ncbi:MAG TPA: Ig-like domain-containing protein [Acidimicrobiales bacterium]|nr:Ig-like domain-containing protein [Acidimicrobiales bacterium]